MKKIIILNLLLIGLLFSACIPESRITNNYVITNTTTINQFQDIMYPYNIDDSTEIVLGDFSYKIFMTRLPNEVHVTEEKLNGEDYKTVNSYINNFYYVFSNSGDKKFIFGGFGYEFLRSNDKEINMIGVIIFKRTIWKLKKL